MLQRQRIERQSVRGGDESGGLAEAGGGGVGEEGAEGCDAASNKSLVGQLVRVGRRGWAWGVWVGKGKGYISFAFLTPPRCLLPLLAPS